jgi:hypothetical protein
MATPNNMRWCHACQKVETFDSGWYEVWIDNDGRFVAQPVTDPADHHNQFRGDTFACGQGSAMVLFERYLHSRTFEAQSHIAPQSHLAAQPQPASTDHRFAELT